MPPSRLYQTVGQKSIPQHHKYEPAPTLLLREKNLPDAGHQLLVNKRQSRTHSVVAYDLPLKGCQLHPPVRRIRQILLSRRIHNHLWRQLNPALLLHDVHVFLPAAGIPFLTVATSSLRQKTTTSSSS